ncbi:indolepyruvate ferredoxin oxidoreductase family protein [Yinghuangia seranimata]|uniref:indolepyruvate ferredoxin oxidoreductase family protein n=1 Tax=Yinghuangia seranimata TaxID=408067 RepID=UPI00248BBBE3|nr:indolepyruvate ferredoxin oxidoreductase family protein [Yinghuangia seranimata]MDI2129947.1 indolepyruvate ferredoxin oxidoreductase family protein [Yinghuangia seranimata]MDI2131625.1 indolepyruvate ferredoxin oxidoreductase family protein [Yinghuangia seranimata]
MRIDRSAVSLDDKYTAADGRVLISGIQALVRLTLEQRRLDTARGLDTRVYVSGYQGSPLGGVDLEMGRAAKHLDPAGVVFQAGLNEELAATAVAGTQLLDQVPGRRHDGVVGFWYGKNPGLDRAADAIRHAMLAGTAPLGGAVAWIGDDPGSKSSTVPSSCEPMAASLAMPLLAPGSVAEIIEYGLHAVGMSRASGLWTGLKIVADIADASGTVELSGLSRDVPEPARTPRGPAPTLVGPASLDAEYDMLTRRLDRARAYAATVGLNRVTFTTPGAKLGILASGTQYAVVQRALHNLGIGEAELAALGLRLIKLGMPFPLADAELAGLTEGLDEVLVVEDKVGFLEGRLKEALYRRPDAPRVVGRRDEGGRVLLTQRGTLGAEDVAIALASRIGADRLPHTAAAHVEAVTPKPKRPARIALPMAAPRTPYFCSGCPHNTSTRTSDDTLVGVGIGCHAMIALDGKGRGNRVGLTQMGGEGTQWFGLAPFTADKHFVQNLGDGTFHHSGSLAVRAAVAAGVTMTYKLLYNDAVAMTGGQRPEGKLNIPDLTRWMAIEGVRRVVITTDEPAAYRGIALDPVATVRHRDDLADVERELAGVEGVTVLIHDDRCAAEERRLRKRGELPTPAEKVVVNERVCEGCGDCGDKSTCLSVQPVDTEFGRKTRIHQASCNSDFSCLKGDCPSFLLVEPGTRKRREVPALPVELAQPAQRFAYDDEILVRMPGIGGTGVVTVSAILQMAAHLDGLHTAGLDQTGLAQKGGPVVSDLRIGRKPVDGALRASRGTADVLLGFDLLGAAADGNLSTVRAGHTVAIVNTAIVPTAAMVTNQLAVPDSPDDCVARIETATRATGALSADNRYLDALALSQALFDDHMPANMLLIGAAFQHGCLPVSAEAVEQAIRLNRAAVDKNLAAFHWGRAAVQDPEAVRAAVAAPVRATVEVDPESYALADRSALGEALRDVLATRIADLTGFQNGTYARSYAEDVRRVTAAAAARVGTEAGERIGVAYAKGLHKLMAYKDEYEVARLHLDTVEKARREDEFGADADVSVLLHPPALRALGMKRKIRLRRTAVPAFRALHAARGLRGTRFDVFGYAKVRRVERELVAEYRTMMRDALSALRDDTVGAVTDFAELPDLVRGYEDIKLARVDEYRARAAAALAELAEPASRRATVAANPTA